MKLNGTLSGREKAALERVRTGREKPIEHAGLEALATGWKPVAADPAEGERTVWAQPGNSDPGP